MLYRRSTGHGVELHAAHGYLIAQFLSPKYNRRNDTYGGSPERRAKVLLDIINGIKKSCDRAFSLGVRLSPERFGQKTEEMRDLAAVLLVDPRIDYLDISLWDVFKKANDDKFSGQSLLKIFTDLPRKGVLLGAAGKLYSTSDCEEAIDRGLDFVSIGRAAIVHSNFPNLALGSSDFRMLDLPVTREHLAKQGLGSRFIEYMSNWEGFVIS